MKDLYAEFLSVFPLLSKLPPEGRDLVRANIQHYMFSEQKLLLTETENCSRVYFVMEGSLRVYKLSEEGREVTLYRLGKGDVCLFTLSCLTGIGELNASIEVLPHTEIVTLPSEIFRNLLKSSQILHQHIMESAFLRLNQVIQVVEMVTFVPMRKRIALFLCQTLEKQNSKILRLTRERIALEIGTAREVVSRVLGELEREGVLVLGRGTVTVSNEKFLKNICLM